MTSSRYLDPWSPLAGKDYHLLRDGTTAQSVHSHRRRLCPSDADRKPHLPKLSQMIIICSHASGTRSAQEEVSVRPPLHRLPPFVSIATWTSLTVALWAVSIAATDDTIRIWKIGSPHTGDTPDATVPVALT